MNLVRFQRKKQKEYAVKKIVYICIGVYKTYEGDNFKEFLEVSSTTKRRT